MDSMGKRFPTAPVASTSGAGNTVTQFAPVVGGTAALNKEDKKRRKGLSGAAKRRIAFWIARGKTYEEAREICLLPLEIFEEYQELQAKAPDVAKQPTKRCYMDQNYLSEATPQKVAKRNKAASTHTTTIPQAGGTKNKKSPPSQSSIRVGIFDVAGAMSADQCSKIQAKILELLTEEPLDGSGPKFLGSTRRSGGLLLICANDATKHWLCSHIPKVMLWDGAQLQVLDEKQIPKQRIAFTHIPDQDVTEESFLKLLAVQNEGIDFASWRVINRKMTTTGQRITLSLDESSCESVARNSYRLYFGLGHIGIKLKPLKNQEGKDNGEWAADEMEAPTFVTNTPRPSTPPSPPTNNSTPREVPVTGTIRRDIGMPQKPARNTLALRAAALGVTFETDTLRHTAPPSSPMATHYTSREVGNTRAIARAIEIPQRPARNTLAWRPAALGVTFETDTARPSTPPSPIMETNYMYTSREVSVTGNNGRDIGMAQRPAWNTLPLTPAAPSMETYWGQYMPLRDAHGRGAARGFDTRPTSHERQFQQEAADTLRPTTPTSTPMETNYTSRDRITGTFDRAFGMPQRPAKNTLPPRLAALGVDTYMGHNRLLRGAKGRDAHRDIAFRAIAHERLFQQESAVFQRPTTPPSPQMETNYTTREVGVTKTIGRAVDTPQRPSWNTLPLRPAALGVDKFRGQNRPLRGAKGKGASIEVSERLLQKERGTRPFL